MPNDERIIAAWQAGRISRHMAEEMLDAHDNHGRESCLDNGLLWFVVGAAVMAAIGVLG